jgi:hypothetical protein
MVAADAVGQDATPITTSTPGPFSARGVAPAPAAPKGTLKPTKRSSESILGLGAHQRRDREAWALAMLLLSIRHRLSSAINVLSDPVNAFGEPTLK